MKHELRFAINQAEEGRTLEGRAIVFNEESTFLYERGKWFHETIRPSAITEELLAESDILLNVDHVQDKVVARYRKGVGNLRLELREDGLYFNAELPNTTVANDLLEDIRFGNINLCSFEFYVDENDKEAVKWEMREGSLHREVLKIRSLVGLSCVYNPAYTDTYVSARSAQAIEAEKLLLEQMNENKEEEVKQDAQEEAVETPNEETIKEERKAQPDETPETPETPEATEEETKEETKEETPEAEEKEEKEERNAEEEAETSEEETKEEKEEAETRSDINIVDKNNLKRKMTQEFSIVKALRSLVNNEQMDNITSAVVEAGKREFAEAGLKSGRGIVIPSAEVRSAWPTNSGTPGVITVAGEGEDVVDVDIKDILLPLHENSVLNAIGVTMYTGLKGDVLIPRMSASQAGWKGEVAKADQTGNVFDNVYLSPKRITAYVDISKQMLEQDSHAVEANIRGELMKAMTSVLERTLFSDGAEVKEAGKVVKPAGLFNGKTLKDLSTYKNILVAEADMKENNVFGDLTYILSPKAEADLKFMTKSTKSTQLVMEDGKVDGTSANVTSFLKNHKVIYGDGSAIALGFWGGIELIVDQYGDLALEGKIRLIANAYVDYAVLRDEALVFGSTDATETV